MKDTVNSPISRSGQPVPSSAKKARLREWCGTELRLLQELSMSRHGFSGINLEIISFMISVVPPPIDRSRVSRQARATSISSM